MAFSFRCWLFFVHFLPFIGLAAPFISKMGGKLGKAHNTRAVALTALFEVMVMDQLNEGAMVEVSEEMAVGAPVRAVPMAQVYAEQLLEASRAADETSGTFAAACRAALAADVLENAVAVAVRADFQQRPAADSKAMSQRAGTWRVRVNKALTDVLPKNTFLKVSCKSGKASKAQELAGIPAELHVVAKLEEKQESAAVSEAVKMAERLARAFAELLTSPNVGRGAKDKLRDSESLLSEAVKLLLADEADKKMREVEAQG